MQVIYDKATGRSRGFGFVTMSTVEEVEAAAQQFNGYVNLLLYCFPILFSGLCLFVCFVEMLWLDTVNNVCSLSMLQHEFYIFSLEISSRDSNSKFSLCL